MMTKKAIRPEVFAARMLDHYDWDMRHLHWDKSRPWTLLFAVIMSAQSTDKQINKLTPNLYKLFPDLESFVAKPIEELERAIFSSGFYRAKAKNLKLCAEQLILNFDGKMPETIEELTTLAGVGRKTANVVLWEVYGKCEGFVVDTHVIRISNRTGLTAQHSPVKIEKDMMKKMPQEHWGRLAHMMVQFGREHCDARKPRCETCFLADVCPKRGVKK